MFEDVGNHVHVKLLTILFVQGNFVHEKQSATNLLTDVRLRNN